MTPIQLAIVMVVAFIVAILAPIVLIPLLRRMGVLDEPNERSSHSTVTVRGAGLATLCGVIIGTAVLIAILWGTDLTVLALVAGSVIMISVVGALEDWRGLPIVVRFVLQFSIGALLAGGLVWFSGAPWYLVPLFAFAYAAYVNIANFMDGINGISALHGLIVGTVYALLGWFSGEAWITGLAAVITASFAAFLPWNLGRGKVFLGDAGSYLLGGSLAGLAITLVAGGVPYLAVITPLSVYLADTGWTLLKRIVGGERWYESHRAHVFQRLTDLGSSHVQSASIVSLFTIALSAIGVILSQTSLQDSSVGFWALISVALMLLVAYVSLPQWIEFRNSRAANTQESQS